MRTSAPADTLQRSRRDDSLSLGLAVMGGLVGYYTASAFDDPEQMRLYFGIGTGVVVSW